MKALTKNTPRNPGTGPDAPMARASRLLEQADRIVETLIDREPEPGARRRLIKAHVFLHEALDALGVEISDDIMPPLASVTDIRAKQAKP